MPFTEEELRAVLEDNSAEVPPMSDLTGTAERQGRRIRRRRYTAGAVAAACVVAAGVGVLTLSGLGDDGGRAEPVAASVSPSPRPVHVDASVLTGTAEDRLIAERYKRLAQAAAQRRQIVRIQENLMGVSSPSALAAFADVVVTGTVEEFTAGQAGLGPPASGATPAKPTKSVVMRVRVDKTLKGTAPGPLVYVRVGSGPDADPARFQAAIPAGARLVAFLERVRTPLGDGGDGTGHPAGTPLMDQQQGLVFEDAGATGPALVGGPYLAAKDLGKPWSEATTVDRLATLLQTVKDDCTALADRLATLKARLRDRQTAAGGPDRTALRVLVDPRGRCGMPMVVRPLPATSHASPTAGVSPTP